MAIIEARGLARTFTGRKRTVDAVRGVDLTVQPDEIVGFRSPGSRPTRWPRSATLAVVLLPTLG